MSDLDEVNVEGKVKYLHCLSNFEQPSQCSFIFCRDVLFCRNLYLDCPFKLNHMTHVCNRFS